VYSVVFSAIWGTMSIIMLRNFSTSAKEGENDWTFGQVISLALLASSLLPIFELSFKSFFSGKY
ncbi:hypothetical protein LY78DRAFT_593388, partial [Colletotrichum sublineola]